MPGPEGLEYLVTLAAGGTKRIKVPFVRPIEGLTQMMTIPAELLGTTLQAA